MFEDKKEKIKGLEQEVNCLKDKVQHLEDCRASDNKTIYKLASIVKDLPNDFLNDFSNQEIVELFVSFASVGNLKSMVQILEYSKENNFFNQIEKEVGFSFERACSYNNLNTAKYLKDNFEINQQTLNNALFFVIGKQQKEGLDFLKNECSCEVDEQNKKSLNSSKPKCL